MKQIMVILFALALNSIPLLVKADAVELAVQNIEAEWARIHYSVPRAQQDAAFQVLLAEIKHLKAQYPEQAEFIIQEAIVIATNAENINGFKALAAIHTARDLLLHAIELNPNASQGAAFVALGSLYSLVPGWPIAYGDNNKAQALLEKALSINPNTIDANYFYATFLADRGQRQEALRYFQRALAIPVRASQVFADSQLHQQAKQALAEYHQNLEHHASASLATMFAKN